MPLVPKIRICEVDMQEGEIWENKGQVGFLVELMW